MERNPTSTLGTLAMELAEHLQEKYGEEFSIGACVIVADVIAGDADGLAHNPIEYLSNDPRRWVQAALLDEALSLAQDANDARREETSDAGGDD